MREIKFRGYAVEEMVNSQWLYGFGVSSLEFAEHYAEEIGRKRDWWLYTESGDYRVHEKSIGQYTGLKDKNGKDVYESDVVQAFNASLDNEKGNNEVIFDNGCFKLRKPNVNDIPIGSYKQNEIEVIGNVFDMPDWEF